MSGLAVDTDNGTDHGTGTGTGDGAGRADRRFRPRTYALATSVAFVATVVVLALQAGTGTAMLTTLFTVVAAGMVCGLWGTAMAVRDTEVHLPSALTGELAEHSASPSR